MTATETVTVTAPDIVARALGSDPETNMQVVGPGDTPKGNECEGRVPAWPTALLTQATARGESACSCKPPREERARV